MREDATVSSSAPVRLDRILGPVDAAALVISNVIGVGIFTTPGIVAQMAPHPQALLGTWFVGGVLALAGALAYAELATLRPKAGGEYVYLREAFGPLVAFLTGWTSLVAGFSGAIAAGAVGFAVYLGHFIPVAADTRLWVMIPLPIGTLDISPRTLVALTVIFGLSAIHICGLQPGRRVQNTLAGTKILALLALIVLGGMMGMGSVEHFTAPAGDISPTSWLLALIPVMFTYSGWNAAAYVAEEVRHPSRNLPLALGAGTGIVVFLYLLLNLLYLYALPIDQMAGSISTGSAAAEMLFGPRAAGAFTLLILVAVLSGLSAMIMAGPRVYFAMARDGVFPRAVANVHPRRHTPAIAILVQAVWSGLLVLSGTFEQLLIYTGFAVVLFAAIAVLALFVLRHRHPTEARPFKAWGYPIAPAFFVLASLAMVVNAIRENPGPTMAGVSIIGLGIPIYAWSRRSRA